MNSVPGHHSTTTISSVHHEANYHFDVHSDAFSKREQADENLYVRQKEQEKLQQLKQKIADHKQHLDELDKHVYVLHVRKREELKYTNEVCRTDQMKSDSQKK